MKLFTIALLLCISSCQLAIFKRLDVTKLRHKFQRAALDDARINQLYISSKNWENDVTGRINADVPIASDWANHPVKDYLAYWRNDPFSTEYTHFLFSMSEYTHRDPNSLIPPPFLSPSIIRSSQIRLTLAEQEYMDQHPDEFLELLDETLLTHHGFWPYVRISQFDCTGLGLSKTKLLDLVENDARYSDRLPRDYLKSRRGSAPHIPKYATWRDFFAHYRTS